MKIRVSIYFEIKDSEIFGGAEHGFHGRRRKTKDF